MGQELSTALTLPNLSAFTDLETVVWLVPCPPPPGSPLPAYREGCSSPGADACLDPSALPPPPAPRSPPPDASPTASPHRSSSSSASSPHHGGRTAPDPHLLVHPAAVVLLRRGGGAGRVAIEVNNQLVFEAEDDLFTESGGTFLVREPTHPSLSFPPKPCLQKRHDGEILAVSTP